MTITIQADTAAEAAAAWWTQQVGAPTYRMATDDSPPEDRLTDAMASTMQTMIADRHPVSTETGDKFAKELAKRIDKLLKRCEWVSLGVDYGPDRDLAEAAEAAGIHLSRFPWKTHMGIRHDYVVAGLGYGARYVLIWSAPGWQRPQCDTNRYTADWEPTDDVCTKPRYHADECGDWRQDTNRCRGCGLTYAGHYGRDRQRDPGDFHSYEPEALA